MVGDMEDASFSMNSSEVSCPADGFSDYQKFTGEKNRQFGARPDSLVIRINLPKVASASIVDVDLGEKTLDLAVPGIIFIFKSWSNSNFLLFRNV